MNNKIDWIAARAKWESDPKLTHAALALELGVSKQAVGKRVKTEGWTRKKDYFRCQRAGYCATFEGWKVAQINYKVTYG